MAATEIELARLAAIVESSSDAIVSKDLNGIVNSWNAAAERIFGFTASEMLGRHITTIIPEELRAEEDIIIGKIKAGQRLDHFDTVRLTKDGGRVYVSLTVSPLKNSRGEVVGASKIARDISDRKRNEQLQSLLIHELNHRTKNLLATIHTIARQTFSDARSETIDLFCDRVQALATSQELLTGSGWQGASLPEMVAAVLSPFAGEKSRIVITRMPDVHLSVRQTTALSLAMHELATNALKYGALTQPEGSVYMDGRFEDGYLTLSWREEGGPEVSPPQRTGFGTRLLSFALQHELGAEVQLEYNPQGLRFVVRFAAAPAQH